MASLTNAKRDDPEYLRGKLMGRAKRLVRLIELNAPAAIAAKEVRMIRDAAILMWPDVMRDELFLTIIDQCRLQGGQCPECGRHSNVEYDMEYFHCPKCIHMTEQSDAKFRDESDSFFGEGSADGV